MYTPYTYLLQPLSSHSAVRSARRFSQTVASGVVASDAGGRRTRWSSVATVLMMVYAMPVVPFEAHDHIPRVVAVLPASSGRGTQGHLAGHCFPQPRLSLFAALGREIEEPRWTPQTRQLADLTKTLTPTRTPWSYVGMGNALDQHQQHQIRALGRRDGRWCGFSPRPESAARPSAGI